MSVVAEPLVLISKISVTYICGRRTLTFNNNSIISEQLISIIDVYLINQVNTETLTTVSGRTTLSFNI